MSRKITYTINPDNGGLKIFTFLKSKNGYSTKLIRTLKTRENGIVLNGKKAKTVDILNAGDILDIEIPDGKNEIEPSDIDIDVIYEDEDLLVVNKSPYLAMHPTHNHQGDTLANAVASHLEKQGKYGTFHAVGRLDKGTSGISVCALNALAAFKLSGKIKKEYIALVNEMKNKIPGLGLSTDIIVGFPNESDEDFNDTLKLVDEVKYDSAFTFIYSPRRGTPAAAMEDLISKETKSKRFKELVKHLEVSISASSNQMVGKTYDVLVDGYSKTDESMLSGYTESNKLVHFKGDLSLVGQIVKVKIIESHTYSLIGEMING